MEQPGEYVSSVAWIKEGNYLAVGTSRAEVQLWDVQQQKRLQNMTSHSARNQLVIWKYPTMAKVAELKGHTSQVLSLTMSPDGATVASAAADETLRLWRCFELDPAWQWEREKASAAKSSLIHQGIS
ncbi:Cell division cycle protein 20-like protein [Plecturocebus cupreus]